MADRINFLDMRINKINRQEIIRLLCEYACGGSVRTAFYVNAHCVNIACRDREYRDILNRADLVYVGGMGVVWASRFLGVPLSERVNILDFLDGLIGRLRKEEITVYLLGAQLPIVKKAAEDLKKKGLKVVGSRDGFFNEEEEPGIIREINLLRPNILMVGIGVPRQEKWIFRHQKELDVKLCWAVGAAFEWISGYRRRAPAWMIKCGLEWLHRLYQQPRRLYKRYLVGNFTFVYHIVKYKLKHRAIND
jgi:N-acetylglucosaminyldiphosphoundecaprenol N-acetyl-beta-D-mannosaminyltransferase